MVGNPTTGHLPISQDSVAKKCPASVKLKPYDSGADFNSCSIMYLLSPGKTDGRHREPHATQGLAPASILRRTLGLAPY